MCLMDKGNHHNILLSIFMNWLMLAKDSIGLALNHLSFLIKFSSSSAGVTVALLLSAAYLWWKSLLLGWSYKTVAYPRIHFYFIVCKALSLCHLSRCHASKWYADNYSCISLHWHSKNLMWQYRTQLTGNKCVILLSFMYYFIPQLVSFLNTWLILVSLVRSFTWLNICFVYLTTPLVAS